MSIFGESMEELDSYTISGLESENREIKEELESTKRELDLTRSRLTGTVHFCGQLLVRIDAAIDRSVGCNSKLFADPAIQDMKEIVQAYMKKTMESTDDN